LIPGLPLLFSKTGTRILTILDSTCTILFSFAAAFDALATGGPAVSRETIAPHGLSRKKLRLAMVSWVGWFCENTACCEKAKVKEVSSCYR
jgi:hypothetical protein